MHYVILRDDDTCAYTPPACLERLYRPFLGRGMPVTLAAIPEVRTDVKASDGRLEGFITAGRGPHMPVAPIGLARELVDYIKAEPGYKVAQHGCHHDALEFGGSSRGELARRLDRGAGVLREAGFEKPSAFVAPYDRLSRAAFVEVAPRFDVISTGWFEARRVPLRWGAQYALKKLSNRPHWRAGERACSAIPAACFPSTGRVPPCWRRSNRRSTAPRSLSSCFTGGSSSGKALRTGN